ncbi:MAG: HEAT repeat domain-containing protein [Candidatus Marinimicrobia bacterium]|nr:HEAT repeat domain-containing protein [Candidatus Neomarinimicrobiota bacterium]MDP6789504.1 HEAT repeat domain-containing protein [Candidatus Neomarinimicrobiota bacterium]
MRKHIIVAMLIGSFLAFSGCSMIKGLFGKKDEVTADTGFDEVERLRMAYQEGKIQALEELISIYHDSNQPFDFRIAAGKALAETHHPTALNAIAQTVADAEAMDLSLMITSIELLATFKDNPKAADAMVRAMHQVEEKTNELHITLIRNLNKVRTKDQVYALLELYEISKANLNRTEKLMTETLGALGTAEVVPILLSISKDPEVNVGIRNRAVEILGKKQPMEVASAFAELLGDPNTNMEVKDFAFNTLGGVKEENLILALLQTYNTGKKQYFSMLNTMLDALGEFNDAEVRLAVTEIALNEDYSPQLRMKAIQKIGDFGDKESIPQLLNILQSPNNYIYRNAILESLNAMGELEAHQQTLRRMAFEAHTGVSQ